MNIKADFENFKEEFPSKEKFYSLVTAKEFATKNMIMFLIFAISFK